MLTTRFKSFSFRLIRNFIDIQLCFRAQGGGHRLRARALHHSHLLHHGDFEARVIVFVYVKYFHVDKAGRCAAHIRHIQVFVLMPCQRLEECMIVSHIVLVGTRSIAEASVKVSRLNDVIVAAELLEINFPFMSTAFFIAVHSTERLFLRIIFGFVQLTSLPVARLALCPHHRSDDVQGRIVFRVSTLIVSMIIDDSQSIFRTWFAVNVDAQRRLLFS